jgi:hypothetical protein
LGYGGVEVFFAACVRSRRLLQFLIYSERNEDATVKSFKEILFSD